MAGDRFVVASLNLIRHSIGSHVKCVRTMCEEFGCDVDSV